MPRILFTDCPIIAFFFLIFIWTWRKTLLLLLQCSDSIVRILQGHNFRNHDNLPVVFHIKISWQRDWPSPQVIWPHIAQLSSSSSSATNHSSSPSILKKPAYSEWDFIIWLAQYSFYCFFFCNIDKTRNSSN